jgi:hypothetical protein
MRLGQLARKLSLRPAQIIEFLAQQNIQIEDNSNTRMEDSHVVLVVQRFAPESLVEIVEEFEEADEVEAIEEAAPPENSQPFVDEPVPQVESEETKLVEEVEVIRVPKIELTGLKVLGRIELPEPKKKEPAPDQIDIVSMPSSDEESPVQQNQKVHKPKAKRTHAKRERTKRDEWNNPLAQQREREAREAEERKRMEIEREKEKRKKYYQEKVKAATQPKRIKTVKDESEIKAKPTKATQPTTLLGKVWKWLRHE